MDTIINQRTGRFSSSLFQNVRNFSDVIEAPEKFLAKAYLAANPSPQLQAFLTHNDHHLFFQKLCEEGKATDVEDARNMCFNAFSSTHDYNELETKLYEFIKSQTIKFSGLADTNG